MKKALSFFLILCMMVLAVPVFVVGTTAEESTAGSTLPETYETAFGPKHTDTWPRRNDAKASFKNNHAAIYANGWTVGYKKGGATAFVPLDLFQTTADPKGVLCDSTHNNSWGWGGMYVNSASMADGNSPWGQFLVPSYKVGSLDVAVRYTAGYTGKITIEVKDLYFSRANHAFAIFVDGRMVFPTLEEEGGTTYYADTTKWLTGDKSTSANYGTNNASAEKKILVSDIAVEAGSVIEFVDRNTIETDAGESQRGMHSPDFNISFTDITKAQVESRLIGNGSYNVTNEGGLTTGITGNAGGYTIDNLPEFYSAEKFATKADYLAYLKKFLKLTFDGPWSVGVLNATTGSYSPVSRWMLYAGKSLATDSWDNQWVITEEAFQSSVEKYVDGTQSTPWEQDFGTMYANAGMKGMMPSNGSTLLAQVYTAEMSGYATFSYADLSANGTSSKICVMVDGVPVFPEKAVFSQPSTWSDIKSVKEINAALSEVHPYVTEGQQVQFCISRQGSWPSGNHVRVAPVVRIDYDPAVPARYTVVYRDHNGAAIARYEVTSGDPLPVPADVAATWDVDGDGVADDLSGLTVNGNMTIRAILFYGKDYFTTSTPQMPETNPNVFRGNWKVVRGHWSRNFNEYGTASWSYTADDEYKTRFNQTEAILVAPGGTDLWGRDGGFYVGSSRIVTAKPDTLMSAAAVYTAPTAGVISVDFTKLVGQYMPNPTQADSSISMVISIVHNGQVVWPSSGEPYYYYGQTVYHNDGKWPTFTESMLEAAHEYEPFPKLAVKEGDTVAFVINASTVAACVMEPYVTYESLINEIPTASADVILKATGPALAYTLNSTLAQEAGVIVNGEKYPAVRTGNDTFVATYDGFAMKELVDDVKAVPYVVINGATMLCDEMTSNPAALLRTMAAEDNAMGRAARAALIYGATAQQYFGYKTDTLATEGLTGDLTPAYSRTWSDVTALSGDTKDVKFQGVSLILDGPMALRVYVDGGRGYMLQYATDADFTDAASVRLTACTDGYSAYVTPADVNGTLYLRVVNAEGEAVSQTLTYSVASYCVRMQNSETMQALAKAILAYAEAVPTLS